MTEHIYDLHLLMRDPKSRDLMHERLAGKLSIDWPMDLIPRDNPDHRSPWEDVAYFCGCFWPLDNLDDGVDGSVGFHAGFAQDGTAAKAILTHRELTVEVNLNLLNKYFEQRVMRSPFWERAELGWTGWMRQALQNRRDR
jgi:hypothetical protein